jgi:uncharacterized repeat protein (TIGR01451 family)
MGDVVFACFGTAPAGGITANIQLVFPGLTITSRLLSSSSNLSEALLLVNEPATPTLNINAFSGSVISANTVLFSNVPLASSAGAISSLLIRVTNIRFNAAALASGNSSVVTTAIAYINSAGTPISLPSTSVATAVVGPGLTGQVGSPVAGPDTSTQVTIPLTFTEGFATAFRLHAHKDPTPVGDVSPEDQDSESIFVDTAQLGSVIGFADSGTRLLARFTNVPSGLRLFAEILSTGGTKSAAAALVAADNSGAGGTFVPQTQGAPVLQEIPIVNSSGSATWEMTNSDPFALDTVQVSLVVQGAGQPPTQAQIGQIGIKLTMGPISTVNSATQSAPLPRFIDTSATQVQTAIHVSAYASIEALVIAGNNVPAAIFTNTITNSGSLANNVVVHDNLPSTLSFVSCTVNGVACSSVSGSDLQIPVGNLGSGVSATVTITAEISTVIPGTSTPLPDGTPITNTISATADQTSTSLASTTSTFIYSSCPLNTCVSLTLATQPPGLTLLLGGAEHQQTTLSVHQGSSYSLMAPSPQLQNGLTYSFVKWSNNSTQQTQSYMASQTGTFTATFAAPSLAVAVTPSGTFFQGDTNAAYTISVGNPSNVATSGTVTVTAALPSSLGLQPLMGNNWACSGSSCSRTDSLGAGGTYDPIVATVSVSPSASSPQMSTVTVAGGGASTQTLNISTPISAFGCDIVAGHTPDVMDLQLLTNQVLGVVAPASDLNADGVVNVLDIQLGVKAVLAHGCLY